MNQRASSCPVHAMSCPVLSCPVLPEGHNLQVPSSVTRFPAAHDEHLVLPTVAVRPCGHFWQEDERFLSAENVFSAQSLHCVDSRVSEYEPGMQGKLHCKRRKKITSADYFKEQ